MAIPPDLEQLAGRVADDCARLSREGKLSHAQIRTRALMAMRVAVERALAAEAMAALHAKVRALEPEIARHCRKTLDELLAHDSRTHDLREAHRAERAAQAKAQRAAARAAKAPKLKVVPKEAEP